jgi:hypothetical protein
MTKYVLQSGGIKNQLEKKKRFHQELVKGQGSAPRFLLCSFAQGREYWEAKFPSYCATILEDMPEAVKPEFKLAMPGTFAADCQAAQIIYMHGGDDHLITYWLQQFDIPAIWKDKVVAGNSAGSDVLVQHYWTCDWRQCYNGLGILPVKFIPHFRSTFGSDDPRGPIDWDKAYQELAAFGNRSLPLHALFEGEYIVIEQ